MWMRWVTPVRRVHIPFCQIAVLIQNLKIPHVESQVRMRFPGFDVVDV